MKLFHISEHKDIDRFIPRRSKQMWGYKDYVWAINEKRLPNYLFPRACPRICIDHKVIPLLPKWVDNQTAPNKRAVVFIREDWEEEFKSCQLYQYEFNPTNFQLIDAIAGYYVSECVEYPISVCKIEKCHQLLAAMEVDVIIINEAELYEIRAELIAKTNSFSIIKWNNLKML